MSSYKKIATILALSAVLFLEACGSAKTPEPTLDPNVIYTQAAATVQSQLTQTALAMPTATITELPTETQAPPPTATTAPVEPAAVATTDTQPGPVVTMTPVLGVLPTAGSSGQKAGDYATFAYNVPADAKSFVKGEKFQLALGLINSGSTTWSENYSMKFIGGFALCYQANVKLGRKVAPGQKGEFDFACMAPDTAGKNISRWKLANAQGYNVPGGEIYFSYTVQ